MSDAKVLVQVVGPLKRFVGSSVTARYRAGKGAYPVGVLRTKPPMIIEAFSPSETRLPTS